MVQVMAEGFVCHLPNYWGAVSLGANPRPSAPNLNCSSQYMQRHKPSVAQLCNVTGILDGVHLGKAAEGGKLREKVSPG